MLNLGNIVLRAPVFVAPMSGVTDAPFRTQAMRFGAPAVVTEMVAGEELARGEAEFVRRAAPHSGDGPFIIQLTGRDPQWMRVGAELAEQAGADVIDINMGCPARRVTTGLAGCALMREPQLAHRLISETVAASRKPVTVKMRLGWDDASLNAPEIARIAEGAGAVMVTVHARTRMQFYNGDADWRRIAPVVEAVKVPVIANGDIGAPAQARLAMEQSGACGVMMGRGVLGRPWRPAETAAACFGGNFAPPSRAERLDSLTTQIRDSVALHGERNGVRQARKHVAAFVDAWSEDYREPGLSNLRGRLCRLDEAEELCDMLDRELGEREAAA